MFNNLGSDFVLRRHCFLMFSQLFSVVDIIKQKKSDSWIPRRSHLKMLTDDERPDTCLYISSPMILIDSGELIKQKYEFKKK